LLLTQLGIPFQRVDHDIECGETRKAPFLAKNPNGKIPVLELGPGRYLTESNAILCFLADDTHFLPADRFQRAQVMQWMFFEQYDHEPNIAVVRRWVTHKLPMTPFREAALPEKRQRGEAALALMEQHLAQREWLVGTGYTIADIALYAYTHVAPEGGFDLGPYPAIRRWLARVAAEPRHIPITDRTAGALAA